MQPARIATFESSIPKPKPGVEIKEIPNRRVAGILSGNGVYALVDGPEGQSVVKPGDTLGEYRVASINSDSVTLKRTVKYGDTSQTYTQVVPLTDVGTNMGAMVGAPGPAMGAGIGPGRLGSGIGPMRGGVGSGRKGEGD